MLAIASLPSGCAPPSADPTARVALAAFQAGGPRAPGGPGMLLLHAPAEIVAALRAGGRVRVGALQSGNRISTLQNEVHRHTRTRRRAPNRKPKAKPAASAPYDQHGAPRSHYAVLMEVVEPASFSNPSAQPAIRL